MTKTAQASEEWANENEEEAAGVSLSIAEENYYRAMALIYPSASPFTVGHYETELALVGASLGGGFVNTQELHVMNYEEAIATDEEGWGEAVHKEYERMTNGNVFEAVPIEELLPDDEVIDSTWACKKKSDGTKRARMALRGFKQVEGKHYDADEKAAPVVNEITINIILVLIVMCVWYSHLVDVKGAFLHGRMDPKHRLFCSVPKGFEKYYPKGVVLRVLKAVYGLIQAANVFWKLLLSIMLKIGMKRNAVDPCLYYKWTEEGLMIALSWVDDVLMCGPRSIVLSTKDDFMKEIDCDDIGEMKEYIGSKVEHDKEEGWIRLTQPVLLQSFEDEFELPETVYDTPAGPGTVLTECREEDQVDAEMQAYYRTGVGKLLYVGKKYGYVIFVFRHVYFCVLWQRKKICDPSLTDLMLLNLL